MSLEIPTESTGAAIRETAFCRVPRPRATSCKIHCFANDQITVRVKATNEFVAVVVEIVFNLKFVPQT